MGIVSANAKGLLVVPPDPYSPPDMSIDPLGKTVTGVVDTQVILRDLSHAVRTGRLTALRLSAQLGWIVAPPHVPAEVDEHLESFALQCKLDSSAIRAAWAQLEGHIKVQPTPETFLHDPRVRALAALDPDDAPTGALALALAPAVILSADKDFVRAGLVLTDDWLPLAHALADVALSATTKGLGAMLLHATIETGANLIPGILRAVRGHLVPATALALILGLVVHRHRHQLRHKAGAAISVVSAAALHMTASAERAREILHVHALQCADPLPPGVSATPPTGV